MDRSSERITARAPAGGPLEAAVVLVGAVQYGDYAMYRVRALTAEGAELEGGLLLEMHEEVLLELRGPERGPVRTRARVVEILPGHQPALRVVFVGLDEAERQRLGRRIGSTP